MPMQRFNRQESRLVPPGDYAGMQEQSTAQHTLQAAQQEQASHDAVQLTEAQLLQQQREQQIAAVRRSYLRPDSSDIQRRTQLMNSIGVYVVETEQQSGAITRIQWSSFARDYAAFVKLIATFADSASLTQEQRLHQHPEFDNVPVASTYEKIQAILLGDHALGEMGMPLFKAICSDEIKVSPAHKGTHPGKHTLHVFEQYNPDQLKTTLDIVLGLISVVNHDLGKAATADGDIYQDHAYISSYMHRELVRAYLIDKLQMSEVDASKVAELLSLIVRYHHGLELVERNVLTMHEFIEILADKRAALDYQPAAVTAQEIEEQWEQGAEMTADDLITYFDEHNILKHIALLTIADRLSVGKKYSMFAISAMALIRKTTEQVSMAERILAQLDTIIAKNFGTVWQTVVTFLQNERENNGDEAVRGLIGQLAGDISNILGLEVAPDTWDGWIDGSDPNELQNRLLAR